VTVVVDTRDLPAEHRRQALYEAFASSTVPQRVAFGGEGAPLVAKIETWTLGPASVFQVDAPDLGVERTERQARSDTPELLAVAILLHGPSRFRSGEESFEVCPGQINLVDMAASYTFSWRGSGSGWTFKVPYDQILLDPPMVRKATAQLRASPLYELVADHIRRLSCEMDTIAADPAGSEVAVATLQLIRALVASAVDDDRAGREACAEALWPLVLAYIEAHLTEHDLSPARIADANNISLRYLYKLCARHDLRLVEWIIERRLQGARQELEGPGSRTVAAIAFRWGFIDPAHFSGRFRQAFAMSPRECRNLARERESGASIAPATSAYEHRRPLKTAGSSRFAIPNPDDTH
jgi:AraC-like DNA-binding protein